MLTSVGRGSRSPKNEPGSGSRLNLVRGHDSIVTKAHAGRNYEIIGIFLALPTARFRRVVRDPSQLPSGHGLGGALGRLCGLDVQKTASNTTGVLPPPGGLCPNPGLSRRVCPAVGPLSRDRLRSRLRPDPGPRAPGGHARARRIRVAFLRRDGLRDTSLVVGYFQRILTGAHLPS